MKRFLKYFTSAIFFGMILSACLTSNDTEPVPIEPCLDASCVVSSAGGVSSYNPLSSNNPISSPVSSVNVISSSSVPDVSIEENFKQILTKEQFESMFPITYRMSFYTYEGLVEAVKQVSALKLKINDRNLGWEAPMVERWTGSSWVEAYSHKDYHLSWNESKPVTTVEADFSKFLNEGSIDDKKREIAAMLAHMSQETTGKGPDDPYNRGLMFNEEQTPNGSYVDAGSGTTAYTPSWSAMAPEYHGRGAFQLSWNYNYARYSYEVYGDNRALASPNMILASDVETYKAAIWFWMRPQYPKPSMHAAMLGTAPDDGSGGSASRFGWTINIINGAYECNGVNEKAGHRAGYYEKYASILGVTVESNLSCASMTPY